MYLDTLTKNDTHKGSKSLQNLNVYRFFFLNSLILCAKAIEVIRFS